jgi:hypothetical protein
MMGFVSNEQYDFVDADENWMDMVKKMRRS